MISYFYHLFFICRTHSTSSKYEKTNEYDEEMLYIYLTCKKFFRQKIRPPNLTHLANITLKNIIEVHTSQTCEYVCIDVFHFQWTETNDFELYVLKVSVITVSFQLDG